MIVPRTGELVAGRPSKIHRRLNKSKGAYSWLTSIDRLLRSEKMTVPIKSNANSHSSPHLPGFSKRHAPPAGTHNTLPSRSPRSVGSCCSTNAIGCNVKDAALNTKLHLLRRTALPKSSVRAGWIGSTVLLLTLPVPSATYCRAENVISVAETGVNVTRHVRIGLNKTLIVETSPGRS